MDRARSKIGKGGKAERDGSGTAEERQKCKLDSISQSVYFPKSVRSAG